MTTETVTFIKSLAWSPTTIDGNHHWDRHPSATAGTAMSFETYAEYVSARRAEGFEVLPEVLFNALKSDANLCNVRTV